VHVRDSHGGSAVDGESPVTVTSSGSRLIEAFRMRRGEGTLAEQVVTSAILEAARAHGRSTGDGVLFVLGMSGGLLAGTERATRGTIAAQGWLWAAEKVTAHWRRTAKSRMRVSWDQNDIAMKCLVRSVVGSKPACRLNRDGVDHISRLIIDAFMASLGGQGKVRCSPYIKVVALAGVRDALSSRWFRGMYTPSAQPKPKP